ncbi:MAG TPA: hypothetical protein PL001_12285, partial [Candidatus Kryptobacter bacterium]|nr:hypothetical protein [Candidatus Kryptobacter bacterium]
MMRTFYSIGILLFLSLSASAKIYVYGRVIGSDGKTMTMANVILTYPGDNRPINEVAVGRGGEY